jgi:hypothetical protein
VPAQIHIIGSSGAAHTQGYATIAFDPYDEDDMVAVNYSSLLTLLPGVT